MNWTTVENALRAWVVAGSGLDDDAVRWAEQNAPRAEGPFISMRLMSVSQVGQDWADTVDVPLEIADDTVESVDVSANTLTLTAHGLLTGDGPVRFTTSNTLPGGLALSTDYWIIRTSANAIKLAARFVDAINLTAIDLTSAGTGTHTLTDTADTLRAGAEVAMTVRGTREASLSIQCFGGTATGATSPRAILESVRTALTFPSRRAALTAAGVGFAPIGPATAVDGVIGSSLFEPRAVMEARLFLAAEVSESGTFVERLEITNQLTDTVYDVDLAD